jgi:hypothetical protein
MATLTATKPEDLIGIQTKEKCPSCTKGLLFTNATGSKWCSADGCIYHVYPNGKYKSPAEVAKKLNYSFSEK